MRRSLTALCGGEAAFTHTSRPIINSKTNKLDLVQSLSPPLQTPRKGNYHPTIEAGGLQIFLMLEISFRYSSP